MNLEGLRFDKDGLIPAIIQDAESGEVLMLAYMNKEALEKSLETGRTHFWSRSRQKLWDISRQLWKNILTATRMSCYLR